MTRIRNRSVTSSSTRTTKDFDLYGTLQSNVPQTYTWSDLDWMEDTVTPKFERRSQKGEIIISPMSKWKTKGVTTLRPFTQYGLADTAGRRSRVEFSAFWGPIVHRPSNWADSPAPEYAWKPVAAEIQRLEQLAITEAYAGVGQPDVSTLVSIGELPETLAFLWKPVKEMLSLTKRGSRWLKSARDRDERFLEQKRRFNNLPPNKRKGKKPPKKPTHPPFTVGKWKATDISSFWMAYRYELMPLIYEFQDWQKALRQALKEPARETSRNKQSSSKEVTTYDQLSTSGVTKSQITEKISFKVSSRAGVMYAPSVEWQTRFGFTLDRVPAAAYELIPLSFVADWFWNGAAVYDALTAEFRAQRILGAWVSTTVEYTYTGSRVFVGYTGQGYTSSGTGGVYFTEDGTVKTRRQASLADIRVKLRVSLNAKRIADGLALIHLFISGRGKH